MSTAVVHCVRHGQVENPDGVIYGRLDGFALTELGQQMAARLGEHFANTNISYLVTSPLLRATQTMAPIAARHPQIEVVEDPRVIEVTNVFQGKSLGKHHWRLLLPPNLWQIRNPIKPSWGEPYRSTVTRMRDAIKDAARHCPDAEAVIVSHELPIWLARLAVEHRPFVHDPRKREARLASVTSFHYINGKLVNLTYSEPAADLYE
ncbi:MAG: histidine phosphatase family protein [Propionibacteriaceae bacterium]|jgi:broad specificity phosphatase PhoE|nr:histidine phosphatase family protein [Propionibacteriaceae bacterium]